MHDLARGAALADEERGVVKQATPVHAVELGGHVEAVDVLLGLDLSPQGAHDREPTQSQLPIDRHVAQAVAPAVASCAAARDGQADGVRHSRPLLRARQTHAGHR